MWYLTVHRICFVLCVERAFLIHLFYRSMFNVYSVDLHICWWHCIENRKRDSKFFIDDVNKRSTDTKNQYDKPNIEY